jgi:hypothetical protein
MGNRPGPPQPFKELPPAGPTDQHRRSPFQVQIRSKNETAPYFFGVLIGPCMGTALSL